MTIHPGPRGGPQPPPAMGAVLPLCVPSRMLPADVSFELREAARIQLNQPIGASRARTTAIDRVVAKAKLNYPNLFRSES